MRVRPVLVPIGPSIAYVELTQGQWSLIDSSDVPLVCAINWKAQPIKSKKGYYAYCRGIGIHNVILGRRVGMVPDHINGDTLNNHRFLNLRHATRTENNRNRRPQANSSGLKGVSWNNGKWRAQIRHEGQKVHLGRFSSADLAYAAYCAASEKLHGVFGRVA